MDARISLFPLLLLASVTLGTAPLTYLYDRNSGLLARLAFGAVVGMTLLGLTGYALASLFGLTPATVWLASLPLLSPLLLLRNATHWQVLRRDIRRFRSRLPIQRGSVTRRAYYGIFAASTALLLVFFVGAMYERGGAIWTTNPHNPGDLTWHLSIIQGFAVGDNFPPEHPELAGTRLTYPFLADFIAAQLVTVGASLTQALFLQNAFLAIALLVLLHTWALQVTRSRFAFLVAPLLIFLNGGWGWIPLLNTASETGVPFVSLLLHPPNAVTLNDADLRWSNLLTTLLGTQRGFLLALPLALIIFGLLYSSGGCKDCERLPRRTAAGLLAGLLPLAHGHSFLAVILGGAALALYDVPYLRQRWRGWLAYFGTAGVLALPQMYVLSEKSAVKPGSFFGSGWGWESCASDLTHFVLFWYRNTGPLLLLVLLALLWRRGVWKSRITPRLKRYLLPFAVCFAVGNSVRLAPWMWDNIKILFYFQLGAALLVTTLLGTLWKRGGFGRVLTPFLLFLLLFSGAIDVWRVVSAQNAAEVYDADAIIFAQYIAQHTPREARLLHASHENHPVLLAGRRGICGSMARLWSHGLEYEARFDEAHRIYGGEPDADALIRRLNVSYIIVGPLEIADTSMLVNEEYLMRFPVIYAVGPYRLLRVR
jgi:hypothetical protein